MSKKTLKEMAEEKGKVLLIENSSFSVPKENIEVLSSSKLIEAKGSHYKAIAIVRSVPVTKFVENLNGRVYPRKLWEKVLKSKVAEGTLCLADHPSDDSDGSVKDIVGVWRNFKLSEETGIADLYLVGKYGGLFLEVLQAGGKNGLSTVGFGELKEDEKTVDPDTYELVRLSDWVLVPSQGVYAETDHIDSTSVKKESKNLKESQINTNLIDKEKRNYTMNPIQEMTIRNNVKAAIKESQKALESKGSSLVDAKKDLQEVLKLIPGEYKEHRTALSRQIEAVEKAIKSTIVEKSAKLKEAEKVSVDINQKYKIASATASKLKEQLVTAGKVLTLVTENEKLMKEDIMAFLEDRKLMESDIYKLIQSHSALESDFKHLVKERAMFLKDVKALMEDKQNMLSDIQAFLKERKAMRKDIYNLLKINEKLSKKLKEDSTPGEIEPPEVPEIEDVQDEEYKDEDFGLAIDPAMAYTSDDETGYGGVPYSNYNTEEGFLEKKKSAKVAPKKIKEAATRTIKVNKDVLSYYNEKVTKKPILKKVKEQILKQGSLIQAVRFVEKFLDGQNDKPVRILESKVSKHHDWIGDRDC